MVDAHWAGHFPQVKTCTYSIEGDEISTLYARMIREILNTFLLKIIYSHFQTAFSPTIINTQLAALQHILAIHIIFAFLL